MMATRTLFCFVLFCWVFVYTSDLDKLYMLDESNEQRATIICYRYFKPINTIATVIFLNQSKLFIYYHFVFGNTCACIFSQFKFICTFLILLVANFYSFIHCLLLIEIFLCPSVQIILYQLYYFL